MRKLFFSFAALAILLSFSLPGLFGQASSGDNPKLELKKHYYGGINGAQPITTIGDSLGAVLFRGMTVQGPKFVTGASIQARITGPFDAYNLPANLSFRTGAPDQLDRMTITSDGLVGIGTTTPTFNLHTVGNTHTSGDFFGRIHFDDHRFSDDAPATYIDEAYFELKQRAVLGVPAGTGDMGGLFSLAPGDISHDHQLFFADDGIFHRRWDGQANSWAGATWYKLLTGEDINGTPNRIAKFTAPTSLGDSQLWDDGAQVGIGTDTPSPGYLLDINGDAITNGNSRTTGNALINGNGQIDQSLAVGGAAAIGGLLNVGGAANISGAATINGLTTINNSANIANDVAIGNDVAVGNDADVLGDLDVSGTAHVDGKVSIATTATPGSHELYVGGSIIAEEVVVKLQGNWPDFVFEPDYRLPSLAQVKAFIERNGHLPNIPSASETAAKDGVELGKMQSLLLQKIEELTLYAIEADARNRDLQKQLSETLTRVETLTRRLEKLEE